MMTVRGKPVRWLAPVLVLLACLGVMVPFVVLLDWHGCSEATGEIVARRIALAKGGGYHGGSAPPRCTCAGVTLFAAPEDEY